MGEHADDYFRYEVRSKFGFDPGDDYTDKIKKVQCKICQRRVKEAGLDAHMRDVHGLKKN